MKQYSWFDNVVDRALVLRPRDAAVLLRPRHHRAGRHVLRDPLPLEHAAACRSSAACTRRRRRGFNLVDRVKHLILPGAHARRCRRSRSTAATCARACSRRSTPTTCAPRAPRASPSGASIWRHAFRNTLIPLTTFAAIDIGAVAGGLIITEQIFGYPGMGLYFLDALQQRRLPVVAAVDDDRDRVRRRVQPARGPFVRVARPEDPR